VNEQDSFADASGGGFSSAGAGGIPITSIGADIKVFGVGVMHNF
jgi:hypothetical protein